MAREVGSRLAREKAVLATNENRALGFGGQLLPFPHDAGEHHVSQEQWPALAGHRERARARERERAHEHEHEHGFTQSVKHGNVVGFRSLWAEHQQKQGSFVTVVVF